MKKILLSIGILLTVATSANAYVDSQYTVTEQYFLNSGYSSSTMKMVELTTRDPYAPTDDLYPKVSAKKFFKMLWKKVDPAAFPDENFAWHNIKYSTGVGDLN